MQWLIGGSLMDLALREESFCRVAHLRGGWKIKLQQGLHEAYADFKKYYSDLGVNHPQKHFIVNMLSLAKASLKGGWPMMKCKAWNAVLILHWLADYCLDHHNGSAEFEERCGTLWAWSMIFRIFENADAMWLTDRQVEFVRDYKDMALQGYNAMSFRAQAATRCRFPMRPKLHQCAHCFDWVCATKRNGFSMWCMSDESVAGQLSRMATHTHASTIHRRVLERWVVYEFSQVFGTNA